MQPVENSRFASLTKVEMEDLLKKFAFQGHNINRAAKLFSQKGAFVSYNKEEGTFIVEKKGNTPITVDFNKIKGAETKWTQSRFFQQRFSEGKIKKLADEVFNQIHPKSDKSHADIRTAELYKKLQEGCGDTMIRIRSLPDISKEKKIVLSLQAFENKEWSKTIEHLEKVNESPLLDPYKLSIKEVLAKKSSLDFKELRKEVGTQLSNKNIKREGKGIMYPSKSASKALGHHDHIQQLSQVLYYAYLQRALEELDKETPDKNQIKSDILLVSKYAVSLRSGGDLPRIEESGETFNQLIEKVEDLVKSMV